MNWKRLVCIVWLCLVSSSANAVTPMIAANADSSLLLNTNGSVWGAGNISGYWPGALSPVRLLNFPNVASIATGLGSQFAVLSDGTVQFVGYGGKGWTDTFPKSLTNVLSISIGTLHALALRADGSVWAWGANDAGQLGDGTTVDRGMPQPVLGLVNIVSISAGADQSLALDRNGEVWFWGPNGCGQAGDGTIPAAGDPAFLKLTPVKVKGLNQVVGVAAGLGTNVVIRADRSAWIIGWDSTKCQSLPVPMPGFDNAVAVSAGKYHFLAVKSDGTVWSWGSNSFGQLGIPTISASPSPIKVPGLAQIVAVAAGATHSVAMRQDGVVFAWGSNASGELGDNGLDGRYAPQAMLAPGGSGQLNLAQAPPASANQLPSSGIALSAMTGVAPLAVQATATNASDPDGTVSTFRWTTSDGQTVTGVSANFSFVRAGAYDVTLFVTDNQGATAASRVLVTVLPAPSSADLLVEPMVALGGRHALAMSNSGRMFAVGDGSLLGLLEPEKFSDVGRVNPVPIANGITGAVMVASGGVVSYVLLSDGSVMSWGNNGHGELGAASQSEFVTRPTAVTGLPAVQAISAGSNHALALTRQGSIFAWGSNSSGQLGSGDNFDKNAPALVAGLNNVIAVAARQNHSFALKADGSVWAWGDNSGFSLGDGTQISRNRPIQIPRLVAIGRIFASNNNLFAQAVDGPVWVTGWRPMTIAGDPGVGAGPRNLSVFDGAVQIAGGGQHIILLKADGTVWTGGQQQSLALGFQASGNIDGLRQLPGITDAIGVAAADFHSVALRRDGTVLTWGRNNWGLLGDGTFAQRLTPVAVVNENANGFLSLKPGISFELPPSVGVPFFAVASGSVVDVTASVSTKTKFNAPDVGKPGAVFVTAAVPEGTLGATQTTTTARSVSRTSARATSSTPAFTLIQLTASGWQPVVNGQLIAYASGVLGDQLAAQTILNNTDTTNLKGAQFCLGYGASADQMIATGTMRVVATIPDPNAANTTTPSCIVTGPPVSFSMSVPPGWSLLGNSLNQTLSVASLYGDANAVVTAWKWDTATLGWQFYTPTLDAAALQTYAASKGFAVLSEIKPGEGYWVNAKAQPTVGTQSGASFITTSTNLAKGWNLVATGNDITPSVFDSNLKSSLPGTGVTSLWAWDNPAAKWYFFAPSLAAQSGSALSNYIAGKGYLDFGSKTLGSGTGFWVNR